MAEWIASPTGTAGGDGGGSPWDLQTALNKTAVIDPGDTLYLRGGTYTGNYTASLLGEDDNNVVVRPYPGERVIWDGYRVGAPVGQNSVLYQINGGYVTYRDFEFLNSDPVRELDESGSNPADRRATGPFLKAPGLKLVNCLVHDLSEGPSFWNEADGVELYGNVVWNNGWNAPDRNHGHALYCQGGTAERVVQDNLFVNSFEYGLHAYGSSAANLSNMTFRSNVVMHPSLIGGDSALVNTVVDGNWFCNKSILTIGYSPAENSGLSVTDNKFVMDVSGVGGAKMLVVKYFPDGEATITGNVFHSVAQNLTCGAIGFSGGTNYAYAVDANAYWKSDWGSIWVKPGTNFNWTTWKAAGYDANGTYTDAVTSASSDYADLTVNAYDSNRAHLVVANFGLADSRSVDLSSFASVGDYIRVRNAQDYFGDVVYIKYTGDAVTLDMRAASHSVALPNGYESALTTTSFPRVGVFVLEKYTPIQKPRSAVPFIRRRRR